MTNFALHAKMSRYLLIFVGLCGEDRSLYHSQEDQERDHHIAPIGHESHGGVGTSVLSI